MASQKGRYFRPKLKELIGTKYDSLTERTIHEQYSNLEFHPEGIDYIIAHKYSPDFLFINKKGIYVYLEVKGYFQDSHELLKYPWIKKALSVGAELVFVFENPNKPIHFKAKRKDGTKMTHAEWAEKNGFRWFDTTNLEGIIDG